VQGVKLDEEWLSQVWHTIRLERKSQKPFKFSWLGDDALMLRKMIEDNWRAFIHEKQTDTL
jgi:hypothetical protein